jgi:transposase
MKLYLGGDASKGYSDWVIITERKRVVLKDTQLDDTYAGHCKLFSILKAYFDSHPGVQMYAAMESTGGYENNWLNSLKSYQKTFDLKVARVNPMGVNFNQRAEMKRNVTDALSALNIARYMIDHPEHIRYDQDEKWKSLCRHWNFVEMQKKQRVQTINQLETLMYSANPSLMRYKKDNLPNWLLEVIILCPTEADLAKAKPGKLAKIRYVSLSRAKELVEDARQGIASLTDKNAALLIRQMALQIRIFDQGIKSQMLLIEQEMTGPEIELLSSFTGIDTTSAIGLLLETGSIERFPTVKGFSCNFGLHPKFKQSGDKVMGIHMSKQGSKNMRKILFNIAKCAIVHNPLIKEIYQRKQSEGMKPMAALGVCMHKILRIVYGILKNKQPFEPQVDKLNTERSKQKQQVKERQKAAFTEKTRRYQQYDSKAPISRKQSKKRKEHALSQGEITNHIARDLHVPLNEV